MTIKTQTANLFDFAANGSSSSINSSGMRELQSMVFNMRRAKYLLIKAPPACGKSRALMYVALDKLKNQGIKKVIVAVPQKAIGSSFKDTKLKQFGTNWTVSPYYDMCSTDLSNSSKVLRLREFFNDPDHDIFVCAHPTLINFYRSLADKTLFNHTLVAIDEFHHVSVAESNQLGGVVDSLMKDTTAHIVAMTGSYFRGDRLSVLSAEAESKFEQVIYTYYQQLNGYKYLKHLKLDYSFHDSSWLDGLDLFINPPHTQKDYSDVSPQDYLNPELHCFDADFGKPNIDLKTIIYIPNVKSYDSTGDKYNEFLKICEILGHNSKEHFDIDRQTGFYNIKTHSGRYIKVANLVNEDSQEQTINSLRQVKSRDDVDIIVSLGMAKEGFDWPWCEHVLVVGFRSSLTEMVQIFGRATRDCKGKPIAKFTNLVKQPDAKQDDVQAAIDDLFKAVSLSLMMEQVLLPNIKFIPRSEAASSSSDEKLSKEMEIIINDDQLTERVKSFIKDPNAIMDQSIDIINNLQYFQSFILTPEKAEDLSSSVLVAEIANYLGKKLPKSEWGTDDLLSLSKILLLEINLKVNSISNGQVDPNGDPDNHKHQHGAHHDRSNLTKAGSALLKQSQNFINVGDLNFTLIEQCNTFNAVYEFVSSILDAETLWEVQKQAKLQQIQMTEEEAILLWPIIKSFISTNHNTAPSLTSKNPFENRLAAALIFIIKIKQKY